jgi:hypothetical protein
MAATLSSGSVGWSNCDRLSLNNIFELPLTGSVLVLAGI